MGDKNDLTPRENEVLALAWQCFDIEPKVDMNKLASLTGYTPGSAAFTMGKIKRKLKNKTLGISASNPTPKKSQGRPRSTPSLSAKRGAAKRAAAATSEDESEPTPSKKTKIGGARKQRIDSDDDDELSGPRIKKEELADVTYGADHFFDQLQNAVGQYDFEQGGASDY
ncbi:hypothetical protein DE146DRAFT_435652 [Phaeosphaeria sp. MPI-PUGE-AT-0046c]|nr:hypothetical protein DE146DRAFT_435652 [Phaeosphaeria sp. MPI-PUGE-AT-0046c]